MASRLYVTVSSETSVLFEDDFALEDMAYAAKEFVRLVEVARDGTGGPWPKEPAKGYVSVTMTLDEETPPVLLWENPGIVSLNGTTADPR